MNDRTVGVAVIGFGRMGRCHAATLAGLDGVDVLAIVDPVPGPATTSGPQRRDLDAVLGDPCIAAAVVAAPTAVHAPVVERLIAAGMSIFCEKPLAATTAAAETLLAAASSAGVPLAVGFHRRHDPDVAELARRLAAGEIGRLETLSVLSHDATPPSVDYSATASGLFHDMTIHDFDLVRFLTGEEVVQVSAVATRVNAATPMSEFDVAMTTLVTEGGTIVQVSNSRYCASGHDQRIEAFGSRGSLAMLSRPVSCVRVADEAGFRVGPLSPGFLDRYRSAYELEIAAWIRSLHSHEALCADGRDGVEASRIADAAVESALTGATVSPARPGFGGPVC